MGAKLSSDANTPSNSPVSAASANRILKSANIAGRLEAFGPQQCVGEVEQQAERDEAGERVIEDHRSLPLQPFAGVGVADAGREEADRERRHEDVHHRMLLLRRIIHG